jgi:hypothetical protein
MASGTIQSVVALGGVALGYVTGLLAPILTRAAERRRAHGDRQAEIARQLFALLDTEGDLIEELRHPSLQQRVSLVAYQLPEGGARTACLELVRASSAPDGTDDGVLIHLRSALASLGALLYP